MLPFHGGDIGSIPVQATLSKIKYYEVLKMKTEDWISVKTDLPKIPDGALWSDTVWVYDEKCGQNEGYIDAKGQWHNSNTCTWFNNVTHWMPLPEDPPKEKTE